MNIFRAAQGVTGARAETDAARAMQQTVIGMASAVSEPARDSRDAEDFLSWSSPVWERDCEATRPMPITLRPTPPKRFWLNGLFSWFMGRRVRDCR